MTDDLLDFVIFHQVEFLPVTFSALLIMVAMVHGSSEPSLCLNWVLGFTFLVFL